MTVTDIKDFNQPRQDIDALIKQARRVPLILFGLDPQPAAIKELAAKDRWVCWTFKSKGPGSKPSKPPIDPRTMGAASIHDPKSFKDMFKAVEDIETVAGVGFSLDNDYIGIDLDSCVTNGVIEPWAQEILDLNETYAEISPTGTGLRLFAKGSVAQATKHPKVEIYSSGRYLTITGTHIPGTPLEINEAPTTLAKLIEKVAAEKPEPKNNNYTHTIDPDASPWRKINTLALEPKNLEIWVPTLFPSAKYYSSTGAWRISAKDLGRAYQEDLSIHPTGVRDFAMGDQIEEDREGKRRVIDVILAYPDEPPATTALGAAEWLCDTLGIDKHEIGFKQRALDALGPSPFDALDDDTHTPINDRDDLLLSAWLKKEIPPHEYIMGNVLTTTCRWLVIGGTGVGKTLFGLDMAAAIAAGVGFLHWPGSNSPKRVMYCDGELAAITFKDRMELIAKQYGTELTLWGYNRDALSMEDMKPFNTPEGQKWLADEIKKIKPDIIFMDSIFCLLSGSMSDEEVWEPVKHVLHVLTRHRVCQVWMHHTGHDGSRGFGTKTREWEMDAVAMLTPLTDTQSESLETEEGFLAPFKLKFEKARKRDPSNYKEFKSLQVWRDKEGFKFKEIEEAKKTKQAKDPDRSDTSSDGVAKRKRLREMIIYVYKELAKKQETIAALENKKLKKPIKVKFEDIRNRLKELGELDLNDMGHVTSAGRSTLNRCKSDLKIQQALMEENGFVWDYMSEA